MCHEAPLFKVGVFFLAGLWIGFHLSLSWWWIALIATCSLVWVARSLLGPSSLFRQASFSVLLFVFTLGLWLPQLGAPIPEGAQWVTGKAMRFTATGVRLSQVRWLNREEGYWERSIRPLILVVDSRNPVSPGQWAGVRGRVSHLGNYQLIRSSFYKDYYASLHLPTPLDHWLYRGSQVSLEMSRFLQKTLGDGAGTIASMLLLGIGADSATRSMLQSSGLSHLFVVSGFHMLLLFTGLWLLMGFVIPHHLWRRLVCMAIITAFVMVIGFSPSALRAWIMLMVWHLFRAFRYPLHPFNAIGLAMLILLVGEPSYAVDIGFLLSFAATIGIATFIRYQRLFSWVSLKKTIPVLGAILFTAPLSVANFGTMPFLAIPFSLILFTPLSMLMLMGLFFSFALFAMGWEAGARVLALGVKPLAELAYRVTAFLSERGGALSLPPQSAWIILMGIMLFTIYLEKRRRFCYN